MCLFKIWEKRLGKYALLVLLLLISFFATAQYTPSKWRADIVQWNRDLDQNGVDDMIDSIDASRIIPIIIDLNRCLTEDDAKGLFNNYLVDEPFVLGTQLTYVYIGGIRAGNAEEIANLDPVALVELAADFRPSNDTSLKALQVIRVNPGDPTAIDNVETAFPGALGIDVNVAIMDTGIDDLGNAIFNGKFVWGYDASLTIPMEGNPVDMNGHGTHIAGTILGNGGNVNARGVAPLAGFLDVKICDCTTGNLGTSSWLQASDGLNWIIENREAYNIRVVNMGFNQMTGIGSDGTDAFSQLVDYASTLGLVMVAPAGNDGTTEIMEAPASASEAITVANADLRPLSKKDRSFDVNDASIFPSSNRGPRVDGFLKPDLSAPGVKIISPSLGGIDRTMTGSSMSAAFVSGVAALLIQNDEKIRPASLKQLLTETATKFSDEDIAWVNDRGYGMVNPYLALRESKITDVGFPNPANPRWTSIDITTHSIPIIAGVGNAIYADFVNNGDLAEGVKVRFAVYDNDVGESSYRELGIQNTVPSSIGSGVLAYAEQSWTPDEIEGTDWRLVAEIIYSQDSDHSNNFAERNIYVQPTASPAVFNFKVKNDRNHDGEVNMLANPVGTLNGWSVTFDKPTFTFANDDCPENITVTLHPPMNAQHCIDSLEVDVQAVTTQDSPFGPVTLDGIRLKAVYVDSTRQDPCPNVVNISEPVNGFLANRLYAPFPNPSESVLLIPIELRLRKPVQLNIFNSYGQLLQSFSEKELQLGYQTVAWAHKQYPPGIYLIQLADADRKMTRKVILR